MDNIWVMVCDSSGARIFNYDRKIKQLVSITELENPEGRLNNKAMDSGPRGARSNKAYSGNRALATDKNSRVHNRTLFAKQLNGFLESQRHNETYNKLYVIAPAVFMGYLRNSMPHLVRETVQDEIVKDLLRENPERVRGHLPGYL